jgi:hypothetical protein
MRRGGGEERRSGGGQEGRSGGGLAVSTTEKAGWPVTSLSTPRSPTALVTRMTWFSVARCV